MNPQAATQAQEVRSFAAYAGMCLIWGSTFLFIRIGNESVAAEWAATVRLTIAAVLLFALARLTGAAFPRGAAARGVALFGFLNMGANFVLLYWGERTVSSGVAAVLYATIPITTGLFAAMLGVQRIDSVKMLAALVGLGGVALIFAGELTAGAPGVALAAVFTAATSASLSTVVLKRVAPPPSPVMTNAIGAVVGAIVCFGASVALGEPRPIPRTFAAWGPILYLVLAGNLGAYMLYAWLVPRWPVTNVATVALIIPVIAVALGAAVRDESLHPSSYAGAVLVLIGVAVSLRMGRARS